MNGQEQHISLGLLDVHVSKDNSTFSPEFWAKLATDKIINVSDTAPAPIRDQANAFRFKVYCVILDNIKSAVEERRARDAHLARPLSLESAALIEQDI